MSTFDFLQRFEEFLGRNGWPTNQSPWSIVEEWEALVQEAEVGYNWDYSEYSNDLGVRDLLAKALEDNTLKQYQQVPAMAERVARADARFKDLLLPNVELGSPERPWWHRGVLAHAGDEYVNDIRNLFGIEVRG